MWDFRAARSEERGMKYENLLGKSCRAGRTVDLFQHTSDVVEAAATLFGPATGASRLGRRWLTFFRLHPDRDWSEFVNNLEAACLFHDWGKANSGMQDVLYGGERGQLFRHEHISVLMLGYGGVDQWIRQRTDVDWDVVLAAVGSHHLKFGDGDFAEPVQHEAVRILIDHPGFQALLENISRQLRLPGLPLFPREQYWGFTSDSTAFDPTDLRNSLRDGVLRRLTVAVRDLDNPKGRMLRAVRAALIAADGAGSGLRRKEISIDRWIGDRFNEIDVCSFEFVQSVVQKRVTDLADRGKWKGSIDWDGDGWNEFQKQCDSLPPRSLLLAPCGAGKTLAAWRWIAAQTKLSATKRILFLYPTRATATEGFKDYVSWAPEADASLLHGTADYDLDAMFPVEDPRSGRVFNGTDPRLFALRHWSKRVFSATIDQFFSFMSYGYGPICLLPLLADSVIVVDEVHSFDRAMFSALLGFLKAFDVPVLCMTATLPEPRQRDLVEVGLHLSNPKPDDLRAIADAERYRVRCIAANEAEPKVRDAAQAGKRVLWVVNQVSRAQAIAAKLSHIGVPLICYHSRFKLDDRIDRHRETINAIMAGQPSAIVISTQVCEMSLDIDADMLITEACPISSLIQRMGRCRRGRDELKAKGPGEVFVYHPDDEKVYSSADLTGLPGFLAELQSKPGISQFDLEKGLEAFGSKIADAPKLNSFLSSGAYAVGGEDSFRDIEAFNVPAVLSNEVEDYLKAGRDVQPGFVVPVPRKLRPAKDSRLPPYLHVADSSHYDPQTGFWDESIR
jgi:CRISPR-associated endonuclease/helicase Cas3